MRVLLLASMVLSFACGGTVTPEDAGRGMDAGPSDGAVRDAAVDAGLPLVPGCWEPGLLAPCCYSESNAGSEQPSLQVVHVEFDAPPQLRASPSVFVFNQQLQQNNIRLGLVLDLTDSPPSLVVGPFSFDRPPGEPKRGVFFSGSAPTEWHPFRMPMTLDGEVFRAGPASQFLTQPLFIRDTVFDDQFQVGGLELETVELSEGRSCVGETTGTALQWNLNGSVLRGYYPVDREGDDLLPDFCGALVGGDCSDPAAEWSFEPDSHCDADGTCELGGCDPGADCNAFRFEAQFGAAGLPLGPLP